MPPVRCADTSRASHWQKSPHVDKIEGGPLEVKIPAGTNPGTILSIPGYGLPDRNKKKRGNLYLEIKGITPKIDDKDILKKVKDLNNGINISTG